MKKKILFVCPTSKWESRERSLLRDLELALVEGNEVLFYGLKNSPLDKKIHFEEVKKIYHLGPGHLNFFLWPKLKQLSDLVNSSDLSLVHCYKLNTFWPICFFLRGNKEVSLVLTQFFELSKNYRAIWHKLLIRRCDLVFVPFEHLVKNVWSRLGVPLRRIEVRPYALDKFLSTSQGTIFEKFEQFYSIGIFVSESDNSMTKFLPFIKALQVSNEYFDWKKPIKLVFVTEGNWGDIAVYQDLKQAILSEGIEEHVVFHAEGRPSNYIQFFDLWMGAPCKEGLEDFLLQALGIGTPILGARSPALIEFLEEYGEVGGSYRDHDVREIVRKWELLLSNPERVRESIEKAAKKIKERHSLETQKIQYLSSTEKVIRRRQRYGQRKSSFR